jgi:hypothetical protein
MTKLIINVDITSGGIKIVSGNPQDFPTAPD